MMSFRPVPATLSPSADFPLEELRRYFRDDQLTWGIPAIFASVRYCRWYGCAQHSVNLEAKLLTRDLAIQEAERKFEVEISTFDATIKGQEQKIAQQSVELLNLQACSKIMWLQADVDSHVTGIREDHATDLQHREAQSERRVQDVLAQLALAEKRLQDHTISGEEAEASQRLLANSNHARDQALLASCFRARRLNP
ncbi:uncharacterized protein RCC_07939 [Ramularia collo-cygni]|uniref:Uncharacterized protein n=1 Tax=Ramularia collo-cygni TaxID=112498 RepID=A0A2D3V9E2_9PEZI|nr:uncharacterized protein RCC_07939 [Ramularia collo-cygni]CZT22070.1 uncharacterized protein RCC_07939 [Ramularia collo-cygni]